MIDKETKNILITGSAGFIASCMVEYLNQQKYTNLILVDNFDVEKKRKNWETKKYIELVPRSQLFSWLKNSQIQIDVIIHLGAKTDTTEFDYSIHEELNVFYSQNIWEYCKETNTPLIYASSAATYGDGEFGYKDDHKVPFMLQPLNPYGVSKNEFDKWALTQTSQPVYWTGLKFFNVYGPNEYHKGRMASVIFHSVKQIKENGFVKLFKSHRAGYNDGEQLRDFVYVKDLVKIIFWMMEQMIDKTWSTSYNGLYNLGTGHARSFHDLAVATFKGLGLVPDVRYIDMPEDLRDKYQYFTEADMSKLRAAGYTSSFYSLEDGVEDYVRHYLDKNLYY